MKTIVVEFTIFGSNQLQTGVFKNTTEQKVFSFLNKKYGKVDYFNACEL